MSAEIVATEQEKWLFGKKEQPIRYMHLRKRLWKVRPDGSLLFSFASIGGITVAYRKIGHNQYKCAFARTNLKDQDHYIKEKGRNCAKSRLLEDDDVWMLDLDEGAEAQQEIAKLVLGIKEFRRALRPEVH